MEVDVAQMQNGGQNAKDRILLLIGEAEHLKRTKQKREVLCIVLALDLFKASLIQVEVLVGALQTVLLLFDLSEAGEYLVEHVEHALVRQLTDYSRLLEQVVFDVGTDDQIVLEVNLQVLSEATRVVVLQSLRITELL